MVIFNQQGWGKQEIEEGIDKDEGRKYKSRPPFHVYPVRKPRCLPRWKFFIINQEFSLGIYF